MITAKTFFSFFLCLLFLNQTFAADLDQVISGGDVENSLENMKTDGASPYVIEHHEGEVENQHIKDRVEPSFMFNEHLQEVTVKEDPKNQFKDVGYTPPGSFEKAENYIELDKKVMVDDFSKHSASAVNISFIKNDFTYNSENDVINRTINEGYKHVKGGALLVRNDQYFLRTDFLNSFWCLGGGVSYSSGRGLFITGDRSDATFRLWEAPLDLGVGLEIPISPWFKAVGAAGPSVSILYQNRSDFQPGEKGKNKMQVSYGEFLSAQFKMNLSRLNTNTAYDLFTESKITNLSMNLEARFQNYQNYQDEIKISGTSFGIGFTFEYL